MRNLLIYMCAVTMVICLGGCGGSASTTAATTSYAPPATLAPPNTHMGGAVQGGTIASKFANYSVSTVSGIAGTAGFSNYSTTNGPPATFNHPTDITTDGASYYLADYGINAIRQLDPLTGAVSTLQCTDAVSGLPVFFNRPTSLTVKPDGTQLYIVDSGSNTIRIIDTATKKVTTIGSTTGLAGSVDSTTNPADVRFNQPIGITTDGANLYVTDSGNHTVRRVDISTSAVSTLAGSSGSPGTADGVQGAARFNLPARITTDRTSLYLTDFNNRTIRQIDILTGAVSTLAGTPGPLGTEDGTTDGSGAAARFNQPNGITTDGTNLYVTDLFHNTVRKIVISSRTVSTISGVSGTAGIGGAVDSPGIPSYYNPIGITTDGDSLLVADSYNNTIRRIH